MAHPVATRDLEHSEYLLHAVTTMEKKISALQRKITELSGITGEEEALYGTKIDLLEAEYRIGRLRLEDRTARERKADSRAARAEVAPGEGFLYCYRLPLDVAPCASVDRALAGEKWCLVKLGKADKNSSGPGNFSRLAQEGFYLRSKCRLKARIPRTKHHSMKTNMSRENVLQALQTDWIAVDIDEEEEKGGFQDMAYFILGGVHYEHEIRKALGVDTTQCRPIFLNLSTDPPDPVACPTRSGLPTLSSIINGHGNVTMTAAGWCRWLTGSYFRKVTPLPAQKVLDMLGHADPIAPVVNERETLWHVSTLFGKGEVANTLGASELVLMPVSVFDKLRKNFFSQTGMSLFVLLAELQEYSAQVKASMAQIEYFCLRHGDTSLLLQPRAAAWP